MAQDDPIKAYARRFHSGKVAMIPEKIADENKLSWKDIPKRDVAPDKWHYRNEPTVVPLKQRTRPDPTPVKYERRKGYVYYVGDGKGRIKIGFSKNPWSRLNEMRRFNPSVEVLAVEKDDGTDEGGYCLEKRRHNQFQDCHLALEWFRAEEKLLDWIGVLKAPHDIMKCGDDFDAKATDYEK